MKKTLTALAISLSALLTTAFVHAEDEPRHGPRSEQSHKKVREHRPDMENRSENRRAREENGVKRLQHMRWQPGYVMPQHYRGNSYKVEYKDANLPKPSRNQQWYKVNKDYLLVDAESNNILKIVSY